jgi:long-subunit fatty acid transport protein
MAIGLIPGFRTFDGTLTVEGSGIQVPRPKLGVLYAPVEKFTIGFVALPGMDIKVKGKVLADVPQAGLSGDAASDDIVAKQRVPTEARLGLGWLDKKWRSEVTFRYYNWSEYKAQTIDLKRNKIGDFAIADLTVDKAYQNSFAVQVGGGYRFFDKHEMRAGYFYDAPAAMPQGVTIQDYDAPKHAVALGYGYQRGDISFDFAYDRVFYQDQEISDSGTTPISVLGTPPNLGNGTYHWAVNMLYVRAGVAF